MSLLTARSRDAFTLAELVIAMALSALLFVTLFSLQKSVMVAQRRQSTIRKLSADSVYALELMKGSVRSASVLAEPGRDEISERILGYINVNPADMTGRLVSGNPQTYFLYCYDRSAGALYKYSGIYPVPVGFSLFHCGAFPASRQARELLAGGLENVDVKYLFSRAATNRNAINISYSLSYGYQTVSGDTSISIQQGI